MRPRSQIHGRIAARASALSRATASIAAVPEALIIDALRTPIGKYGGTLAAVRPDDLAAFVVERAVARNDVDPESVDEVIFGNANGAGEENRNVARMAVLLAGLPDSVPGATVNRLCASGLEAVNQAARAVKLGDADLVLAGGVESMTRAPLVALKPERGYPRGAVELVDSTIGWRFTNPRMAAQYSTEGLGETAENVAERYGVGRQEQDSFALRSHQRAVAAQDAGAFDRELEPVSVPQRRGDPIVVDHDEGPRADTSAEALARLAPVFREGGTVTAGNSAQINDGAACVVVGSEAAAERMQRRPLARIVSIGVAGVDPGVMGIGPVPASRMALQRAGLDIADIDLVELNEAFASQAVYCQRQLDIPDEKLNVNGGAIAIGHPLGCSGARLIGTLAHELRARGGRYGLATLCIGVGMGLATIIESV
jgi:3-oxoadipyl-CoA thiolase